MRVWSCFCGTLSRLKHRGVRCSICRTECFVKQPTPIRREVEMALWLSSDYQHLSPKNAIRLTLHTGRLVRDMQRINEIPDCSL